MMTMRTMFGDKGVFIMEYPSMPGIAHAFGGPLGSRGRKMSLREAEGWKDNNIRSQLGLENLDEMPQWNPVTQPICRRCGNPSQLRCVACRTRYCSKSCQRKHWWQHLFSCAVPTRPGDADYLRLPVRRHQHILSHADDDKEMETAQAELFQWLYADDRLCRLYGFTQCLDSQEVSNLLCIYDLLLKSVGARLVSKMGLSLGEFLVETWILDVVALKGHLNITCNCVEWFLSKIADGGLTVPDLDGEFTYQEVGFSKALNVFGLDLKKAGEILPRSPVKSSVVRLYGTLFRPFNNMPDQQIEEWMGFGFWGCRNREEEKSLARAYLDLAERGASLEAISAAWETSPTAVLRLMETKDMDTSRFRHRDAQFNVPDQENMGIYALMVAVSHALSGRYCPCFRPQRYPDPCTFHPKHETFLSKEADGNYGFHGTNPWERWQLLNFYHRVFQHPRFDPRKMQEAKRDHENENGLDEYLDTLVPNFRRSMENFVLADGMFPKLRMRLDFPRGRVHCHCAVHTAVPPEGLGWKPCWYRQWVSGGKDEEEEDGEEEE